MLRGLLAVAAGLAFGLTIAHAQELRDDEMASRREPSLPSLYDVAYSSVVRFRGPQPGSGFVASLDLHIVTAWHVLAKLDGAEEARYLRNTYTIEALDRSTGLPCEATVELVGATEYRDVAVLQVVESERRGPSAKACLEGLQPVKIRWDEPKEEDGAPLARIYTLGFPDDPSCSPMSRCFRVFGHNVREPDERTGHIQAETQVPVGMSGGPALNARGEAVGMNVQAGYEALAELTLVAPIRYLRRAFWTFGIAPDESMSDYTEELADLLSKAERLTDVLEEWKALEDVWEKPSEVLRQMAGRIERIDAEFEKMIWQETASLSGRGLRDSYASLYFEEAIAGSSPPVRFEVEIRCRLADPTSFKVPDWVTVDQSLEFGADAEQFAGLGLTIAFDEINPENRSGFVEILPKTSPVQKLSGNLNLGSPIRQIQDDCAKYYNIFQRSVRYEAEDQDHPVPDQSEVTAKDISGADVIVHSIYKTKEGAEVRKSSNPINLVLRVS